MPPQTGQTEEQRRRTFEAAGLTPEQQAGVTAGTGYTPASPITSDLFRGTTLPNFQTTQPTVSSFPIQDLQPIEKQEQTLRERLTEVNRLTTGESALRQGEREAQGITGFEKTQEDLTSQLKMLLAQSKQLDIQATLLPSQIQEQFAGRGATRGGVAPIEAGELRKLQIRKGLIASDALLVSANLDAIEGRIATASRKIEEAVRNKFDPIREERDVLIANLELVRNSPELTRAQKARAEAQLETQRQLKETETRQREDFKAAQELAVKIIPLNPNIDSLTTEELRKAQTAFEVVEIAKRKGLLLEKPTKETFAAGNFGTLQRILGRDPTREELISYERDISAAGRALEKPKAPDEPLSTIDIQRIEELYGITVPFGTTQKQAEGLIEKENTPEAKTRKLIVSAQENGNDYETVIREIEGDATIKDKETAKQIAQEVFGVTTEVAQPKVFGRGRFARVDITDRVNQLKATLREQATTTYLKSQLQKDGYPVEAIRNATGDIFTKTIDAISNFLFR